MKGEVYLNLFVANVPFLHTLKTSEKLWLYVIIMSRARFRVNLHYSCLNVNERFAGNGCDIWSLSDSKGIRTHNHLVRKRTLNHLAGLVIWLSFCLRNKCLWVRISLLPLRKALVPYVFEGYRNGTLTWNRLITRFLL